MFDFFKKKPPLPAPHAERIWFIQKLFDKVRKRPTPEERLLGYIGLWESIIGLENDFEVECIELAIELDYIRDALSECSDPGTIFIGSVIFSLSEDTRKSIREVFSGKLPDHLKARLLKTYILSEIDHIKVDPREIDPTLQHAFYEVERRKLSDSEKRHILEAEFGIHGWRSQPEMNPDIMYNYHNLFSKHNMP